MSILNEPLDHTIDPDGFTLTMMEVTIGTYHHLITTSATSQETRRLMGWERRQS